MEIQMIVLGLIAFVALGLLVFVKVKNPASKSKVAEKLAEITLVCVVALVALFKLSS